MSWNRPTPRLAAANRRVTAALQRRDAEAAAAAMETHLSMVQARAMGIEIFLGYNDSRHPPIGE